MLGHSLPMPEPLSKCRAIVKVKVQIYSLISSLKTYHPTLHLTPWSLDLFIRVSFLLHGENTVLQPFRRIELIVHIAISVLPGTHFHLSQVKHLRVKCLGQGHNILTMSQDWEGRNMLFLWKFCTKRDSKPHGSSEIGRAPRSNHCAMSLCIVIFISNWSLCNNYNSIIKSMKTLYEEVQWSQQCRKRAILWKENIYYIQHYLKHNTTLLSLSGKRELLCWQCTDQLSW